MNSLPTKKLLSALLVSLLVGCGGGLESPPAVEELTGESADELSLSRGRFETFLGRDGRVYFQLLAGNGEKVLASQSYASLESATGGIDSVKTNGTDTARYQLREAKSGEWYFVLKAANGRVIGVSETYVSRSNAERAVEMVARIVRYTVAQEPAVPSSRFQTFRGVDGQYYFHLRAWNGEVILQSEGYVSRSGATNGIDSVSRFGAEARWYELREASDDRFYFVLRASNGQVIGRSEVYASKAGAENGIEACVRVITAGSR